MTSVSIEHIGDRFAVVVEVAGPGANRAELERVPALVAAAGYREPEAVEVVGATCRVIYVFGRGDGAAALHWSVGVGMNASLAVARPPFAAGWQVRLGMAFDHVMRVGGALSGSAITDAARAARWSRGGRPILLDALDLRMSTVRIATLGCREPWSPDDTPTPLREVSAPDAEPASRTMTVLAMYPRLHKQVELNGVIVSGNLVTQGEVFVERVRHAVRGCGGLLLAPPRHLALVAFDDLRGALAAASSLRVRQAEEEGDQPALLLGLAIGEVVAGPDGPRGSGVTHGEVVGNAHRSGDFPVVITREVRAQLLELTAGAAAAACPEATRVVGRRDALEVHDLELRHLDLSRIVDPAGP